MSNSKRNQRGLAGLHPIWRGIGCILMVVTPIAGYFVSNWGINYILENSPEFTRNLARGVYPANMMLYMRIGGTILSTLVVFFLLVLVSSFLVSIWGRDEGEEKARGKFKDYRSQGH